MKTTDSELITIGLELIAEKERQGLQRQEIAKMLKCSPGTITKWLDPNNPANPRSKSLTNIFRTFGMDPKLIARLLLAKDHEDSLKYLLKIIESKDDGIMAVVENSLKILSEKV
jgi:transcriptional regulator with XRE-family HTH domain